MPISAGSENMVVFSASGAFIHDHATVWRSTREDGIDDFAVGMGYSFTIFLKICR
jgi:hypothetical protein